MFPASVSVIVPVPVLMFDAPLTVNPPAWEIPPTPVCSVSTPGAKVAGGVQVLIIIAPALRFPICTLVARTEASSDTDKLNVPAPVDNPIVVPAVNGCKIAVAAIPIPAPVPPIWPEASSVIVSAVSVAVPVVSR